MVDRSSRDLRQLVMRGHAPTRPLVGGLAVGLMQAQVLRDVARQHINAPGAFSREYDAETERRVTPFYRTQIAPDRARRRDARS